MKKLFCFFAAAMFCCASISAVGTKVTVETEPYIKSVDAYTLDITVENGAEICAGSLLLAYDSAAWKLESLTAGDLLAGQLTVINPAFAEGQAKVSWAGTTPLAADGTLLQLTLSPVNDVPANGTVELLQARLSTDMGISIPVETASGGVQMPQTEVPPADPVPPTDPVTPPVEDGKQPVTGTVIPGSQPEQPAAPRELFRDVPAEGWYVPAVAYAVEHNLLTGVDGDWFEPFGITSRAMAAQMLMQFHQG